MFVLVRRSSGFQEVLPDVKSVTKLLKPDLGKSQNVAVIEFEEENTIKTTEVDLHLATLEMLPSPLKPY